MNIPFLGCVSAVCVSAFFLCSTAFAEETKLSELNVNGVVSVNRVEGKVVSVSIKDKKDKTLLIKPIKSRLIYNGKPRDYKIDEKDLEDFAKFEGKKIHAFIIFINETPVDIKSVKAAPGFSSDDKKNEDKKSDDKKAENAKPNASKPAPAPAVPAAPAASDKNS